LKSKERRSAAITDFAIIPSRAETKQPERRKDREGIDAQTLARAKVLGQVALQRASMRK
jgi:hypothetical protein